MILQDSTALRWVKKYLRFVDYMGVAQLYLKDNFFLEEPLKPEHIKARVLGHWGTVPGLNFIYANLNYLIYKHKCEMLLVTGPGHGAPAILANLYMEGALQDVYKEYPLNKKGFGKLTKDFSWPHSLFPSHVTPSVPGSILEGGELGYSLSTAYGAVLDNPNLIAVAIIGDGEAETGPIAGAWQSNKFFNPKTCGAVLPIVHINGYKISNPTIFGRMSDTELRNYFKGLGYWPLIVSGSSIHSKMIKVLEKAYKQIRDVQFRARNSEKAILKPMMPVILLRTPKGWNGIPEYKGKPVAGSFRSHGIPVENLNKDPEAFQAVEKWLRSYKIHKLIDEKGAPLKKILKFVPKGKLRMGMNPHAVGGNLLKKLNLPNLNPYSIKLKSEERGLVKASSMVQAGKMMRDIFKTNPKNFRLFCPDEVLSNKLDAVFEQTKRAFMWPQDANDELIHPEGRVMEMLSEHTLQGWYMGYLLTGRHGIFVSYEAFTTIITSMLDQYAKFLKQSFKIEWRTPVSSAVYLQSSLGWRQDHNGFSHQNPSFVSNVLQKHGEFCQIYYPPDANSMLVALEEVWNRRDSICVIVAGKRDLPQWLTLEEARKQAKVGLGIWEWVSGKESTKKPDVVLASAGDYITQEAISAVKFLKELAPELKVRYVNVSELTALSLGDNSKTSKQIEQFFTKDKPVVFAYHGYTNDMEQILWPMMKADRCILRGYKEQGSTTTPFDLKVANEISFYHLSIDMIEQASKSNKAIARKKADLIKNIKARIRRHQKYIVEHGDDPVELRA